MKNLLLLAMIALLAACGQEPAGEKVDAEEAQEVTTSDEKVNAVPVRTSMSTIRWEGSKLVGGNHTGTIDIKEGTISVADDNTIVGGRFVIDMTSIKNEDLPEDKQADLVGHLSSGDFFEVEKYPEAIFEITNVEPATEAEEGITHKITGNLTMKDVTKSITIPAKMQVTGSVSASTPQFVIDRTEWNVMYGAGALGVAKDKIINDNIGLSLELRAK